MIRANLSNLATGELSVCPSPTVRSCVVLESWPSLSVEEAVVRINRGPDLVKLEFSVQFTPPWIARKVHMGLRHTNQPSRVWSRRLTPLAIPTIRIIPRRTLDHSCAPLVWAATFTCTNYSVGATDYSDGPIARHSFKELTSGDHRLKVPIPRNLIFGQYLGVFENAYTSLQKPSGCIFSQTRASSNKTLERHWATYKDADAHPIMFRFGRSTSAIGIIEQQECDSD